MERPMALALHTLCNEYRRASAYVGPQSAFQAPVFGDVRFPVDHDITRQPKQIVAEMADDLESVERQIAEYLALLVKRAKSAGADAEQIGEHVDTISDQLSEIRGLLTKAAERLS
jgi:hypothetical protein